MSNDMAANNYFSHTDSLGRSTGARLAAFGYTYSPWGENLAAGYADAQSAFTALASACDPDATGACTYAHRQNMLGPAFKAIGIARASSAGSAYGWYWTTDFGGYVEQAVNPTPSPSPGTAPTIASFSATPPVITAGQTTTLAWTVSGATTTRLDNGIGDVSSLTSKLVLPTQTTSYHLTATNSYGSVTAVVTVAVNSPVSDTQPPSAPNITSIAAKSANEVDLVWTASTDNIAVTGYRIIRNAAVIVSLPPSVLAYADSTAAANTSYSYVVRAYDAASNYRDSSPSPVTTPAPPLLNTCPAPAIEAFTACYYNGTDLSGYPALVRTDSQVNFDWWSGSPDRSVSRGSFSVRWQGNFSFAQGDYTFSVTASDGVRLYIDGTRILDQWRDQPRHDLHCSSGTQPGQPPDCRGVLRAQRNCYGSRLLANERRARRTSAADLTVYRRSFRHHGRTAKHPVMECFRGKRRYHRQWRRERIDSDIQSRGAGPDNNI